MREIKFRAWDSELKQMITEGMILVNGKLITNKIRTEEPFQKGQLIYPDWELMQFTGLQDKNGKNIYEGDIVRIQHPHDVGGDFMNTLGRVFWYEGAFYHGNQNGRPPKRMWEYCEVVGNVFENPELLKGEE